MYSQVPPFSMAQRGTLPIPLSNVPARYHLIPKNCNEDDSSEEADREPAPDTRDRTSNLFEDGSNLLND